MSGVREHGRHGLDTRTTPAQASTHLQGLRLFSKVDGNVKGEDVIGINLLPARMWNSDAKSAERQAGGRAQARSEAARPAT